MLGGLLGLRLKEELAVKADLPGVLNSHVHELGEMVYLALHVGVVQVLVAFAAAPEDVIFTTELPGDLDRLLHLCACIGESICIAAGRRTMHIAGVAEKVCRAPEKLDTRPLLLFLQRHNHLVEVCV